MNLIVIPAKSKSTRLPNKNFIPFYCGLSLLQIAYLRSIWSNIGNVVVSTDNFDLANRQINKVGGEAMQVIQRPDELCLDPATILDVLRHAVETIDGDYSNVITILPTSPLNSAVHIIKAHTLFNASNADKLISVSKASKPPFNALLLNDLSLSPAFPDNEYSFMQSTRCPATYYSNGCIGIYNVRKLMDRNHFESFKGYEMDMYTNIDIDYAFEFSIAQSIFSSTASDLRMFDDYIIGKNDEFI